MAERDHFSSEKWEVISQENHNDAPEEQGASFFLSQEHYKVISCDMKKPSGRMTGSHCGGLKFTVENGILEVPHKARKGFRQRKKGSPDKAVVDR